MLKMVFDSFDKKSRIITFNVKTYENNNLIKNDEIYFKFNEDVSVSDNHLAIALSTFCGQVFDEIYYDLCLSEKIINNISSFTKSNVSASSVDNNMQNFHLGDEKIMINFSGGMDSLAAKILLGDCAQLVSISFFDREYDFFKKFNPHTLETNFRQLGYADNDWTFMGVGSILFSNYLNCKYHLFGTILEAYYMQVRKDVSSRKRYSIMPFCYAGLTDIKLIQGITEIGTALIVCNSAPYLVNDSLISLSPPGSEKRYRKQLIIDILKERFDLNLYIDYVEEPPEERKLIWGNYFAVDFLTFYMVKYAGIEETSKIMKNIPEELVDFSNSHELTFYERFNTNYLNNIPPKFKDEIMKNLLDSKIFPYTQNDFDELYEVVKFLSKYHPYLEEVL